MSLHGNLLGPEPTQLPVDPAVAELAAGAEPAAVAAARTRRPAPRGQRSPRPRSRTVHRLRRTPTPAPATTAGWTSCDALAGRVSARCPGPTSPTVGSCVR